MKSYGSGFSQMVSQILAEDVPLAQVAAVAGISVSNLRRRMKSGRWSVDQVAAIAIAYGLAIEEIYSSHEVSL